MSDLQFFHITGRGGGDPLREEVIQEPQPLWQWHEHDYNGWQADNINLARPKSMQDWERRNLVDLHFFHMTRTGEGGVVP